MFVYRPHVQGSKDMTTPDLVLDQALASDVWSPPRAGPIGAAWVIVVAQYAPLLTVGLTENGRPWILARTAWRLSDLDPRWSGLTIGFASSQGEALERLSDRTAPAAVRGTAMFLAMHASAVVSPRWCRVTLEDAARGRSIVHEIQFTPNPESHR